MIGLTGPLLPVVSFPARLPTATIQFGSVLLLARTSGSLAAAGLTGGALAVGQVVCGPLVGRLADRHGRRAVVLGFSLADALAPPGWSPERPRGSRRPCWRCSGLHGATVPQIGPMARARLLALARRAGARDATVGAALSLESALDEVSFVLGPALVGLAAVTAHPAHALGGAAVLVATCGSGFALHRTAAATRPGPEGRAPAERRVPAKRRSRSSTSTAPAPTRTPRAVHPPRAIHSLRAALALQGAMFGACQAGITALTERLGQPDQAGLVYAAMGVTSAVAGLCMAAVPARVGLTTRRRAATAAACALSLTLLWTDALPALYATVTVLGVAYAPHLITVFGLAERVVPPARLAEAMALATSALVGGQTLAVAVTGRLAESYGPAAAFGAASLAAALACLIAPAARPESYTGRAVEESDGL
ncbi:MFS transporter [Streptomyces chartreusis]